MSQCIVPLNEIVQPPIKDVMRYNEARQNSTGKGKSCAVTFLRGSDPVKLVVQTPKMWCQFGVDEFKPDDGGPPKYSIRLGFKNLVGGGPMADLHRFIKSIDANNVEQALANQSTWWPNTGVKSRDIIEDRYTPIIKSHESGQYEDQMRVKLMFKNGVYDGLVFNDSSPPTEISTSQIEPKCHLITLLEFGPIWIADKSFGQTIRAVQIKVFKQQSIRSYAITDVDMEDAETEEDTEGELLRGGEFQDDEF